MVKQSVIRISSFCLFTASCLRKGIAPWSYVELNGSYMDHDTGAYSKHELNCQVPDKHRLPSVLLPKDLSLREKIERIKRNFTFPLVLKPDWGHNSFGVHIVHDNRDLREAMKSIQDQNCDYLCQEFCEKEYEYEIYFIRDLDAPVPRTKTLSIARVMAPLVEGDGKRTVGDLITLQHPEQAWKLQKLAKKWLGYVPSEGELFKLTLKHGIPFGAMYSDLSKYFTKKEKNRIFSHISSLGDFSIGRVTVKANSSKELIAGDFQVIESNILYPFPIHLLDPQTSVLDSLKDVSSLVSIVMPQLLLKREQSKPDRSSFLFYMRNLFLTQRIRLFY